MKTPTETVSRIHFTGIGGAGMAPLAHLALERGLRVSGSDEAASRRTDALQEAGAAVYLGHASGQVADDTELLVYSSAVAPDNPERKRAEMLGIPQLRRGDWLGVFSSRYRRVAAVSGSHGKSTVSAMLSHILAAAGLKPGWLIGAEVNGGNAYASGEGDDIFVTEADESDGTHTALHPFLGIVPNVDDDHAWGLGGSGTLYGNFGKFASQCRHLLYYGSPLTDVLFASHPEATRLELPDAPDFRYAGFHGFQAADALLAARAAAYFGVTEEQSQKFLLSFPGIARRMTVRLETEKFVLIEDYAHHPREVASSLAWLRTRYPGCGLRILFQPHRYARLERYFDDFVRVFGNAGWDKLLIARVFAAWCETGRVDHRALAQAIKGADSCDAPDDLSGLPELLTPSEKPVVVAVIGAGDINSVIPELALRIKQG